MLVPVAALLVSFAGVAPLPGLAVQNGGDAAKVTTILQHVDTIEGSAKAAKDKTGSDAQALSALEKKYADAATAFDNWRTAAASATEKEWSTSRKRIADLSKTAARLFAEFGQDSRTYLTGSRGSINWRAVSQFETRLVDAARALAASDQQTRDQLAAGLVLRPWNDIH